MSRKRALAIGWTVLVIGLHAIPRRTLETVGVGALSQTSGPDKLVHVVLFDALGVFWLLAVPRRPWAVLLACLAFGVVMELMQSALIPGRTGSVEDFAADAIGVLVGVFSAAWYARRA